MALRGVGWGMGRDEGGTWQPELVVGDANLARSGVHSRYRPKRRVAAAWPDVGWGERGWGGRDRL